MTNVLIGTDAHGEVLFDEIDIEDLTKEEAVVLVEAFKKKFDIKCEFDHRDDLILVLTDLNSAITKDDKPNIKHHFAELLQMCDVRV